MQVTFFIFFVISRKLFALHAVKLLSIDFEPCSTTYDYSRLFLLRLFRP